MPGVRRWQALAVLLTPLLAACPQNLSTSLVQGSTAESLIFDISNAAGTTESGRIVRFSVVEFGGLAGPGKTSVLWQITASPISRGGVEVAEIRYGLPPTGFVTDVGPHALVPGGRYLASVGGAGVEFRVADDGGVSVFDPTEASDRFQQAGLSEDAMLRYWDDLQAALDPPSADGISELAHYPLLVSAPDSTWHVDDRHALVREFDSLFTEELVAELRGTGLEDVIVTSRGVAVALGRLWIGGACEPDAPDLCVPVIYRLERLPPR